MTYIARMTNNRRDIYNMNPKRLLLNITDEDGNEFRDHLWTNETDELVKITPNKSNKPIWISFTAETKPYLKRGTMESETLHKITNIKRIKKGK